jgi:hypothetical protein
MVKMKLPFFSRTQMRNKAGNKINSRIPGEDVHRGLMKGRGRRNYSLDDKTAEIRKDI